MSDMRAQICRLWVKGKGGTRQGGLDGSNRRQAHVDSEEPAGSMCGLCPFTAGLWGRSRSTHG